MGDRELGSTRGYRRNGGKYYYHGNKKTMFVRCLRRDAVRILADPLSLLNGYNKEGIVDIHALSLDGKGGLIEYLRKIPEPRKARGIRHGRTSILAVAICALLSGAKGFSAIGEWAAGCSQSILRKLWCRWDRRKKRYTPPSEPTIRRLLHHVDAAAVDHAIGSWLLSQGKGTEGGVLALDGKTLKGAGSLHLLSAFLHHEGIAIAQKEVAAAGGEIEGARQLLKDMEIGGMVVTADALHTQKETATFLVQDKGADYFFTVKDNHSTLKSDIESLQWEAFPPPQHETIDKGHGHIETRRIRCSTDLKGYIEFPFHEQVVRIDRITTDLHGDHQTHEVAYGITSLTPHKASRKDCYR